jgi:hypothetical protein
MVSILEGVSNVERLRELAGRVAPPPRPRRVTLRDEKSRELSPVCVSLHSGQVDGLSEFLTGGQKIIRSK